MQLTTGIREVELGPHAAERNEMNRALGHLCAHIG